MNGPYLQIIKILLNYYRIVMHQYCMSKNLLIAFAKPILLRYYFVFRFHPPPEKIELILDGEMKELFPELSGTFVQGAGLVNKNPSAIWYYSYFSDWIVGNEQHLGKFWGNVYVPIDPGNTVNDTNAPKWIDVVDVNFKVIGMCNCPQPHFTLAKLLSCCIIQFQRNSILLSLLVGGIYIQSWTLSK